MISTSHKHQQSDNLGTECRSSNPTALGWTPGKQKLLAASLFFNWWQIQPPNLHHCVVAGWKHCWGVDHACVYVCVCAWYLLSRVSVAEGKHGIGKQGRFSSPKTKCCKVSSFTVGQETTSSRGKWQYSGKAAKQQWYFPTPVCLSSWHHTVRIQWCF